MKRGKEIAYIYAPNKFTGDNCPEVPEYYVTSQSTSKNTLPKIGVLHHIVRNQWQIYIDKFPTRTPINTGLNLLHFHGVSRKIWSNNRLMLPFGIGTLLGISLIHHWKRLSIIYKSIYRESILVNILVLVAR